MDGELDQSTLFYTDDQAGLSLLGKEPQVQQSFIFGADQFSQSTREVVSDRGAEAGEAALGKKSRTETQWSLVIRHWFLSMTLLPAYVLALVTHSWKTSNVLTRTQGTLIVLFSVVFYTLIWASFGMLVASPPVRTLFPPQSAGFVYFLYSVGCFSTRMSAYPLPPPSFNCSLMYLILPPTRCRPLCIYFLHFYCCLFSFLKIYYTNKRLIFC